MDLSDHTKEQLLTMMDELIDEYDLNRLDMVCLSAAANQDGFGIVVQVCRGDDLVPLTSSMLDTLVTLMTGRSCLDDVWLHALALSVLETIVDLVGMSNTVDVMSQIDHEPPTDPINN